MPPDGSSLPLAIGGRNSLYSFCGKQASETHRLTLAAIVAHPWAEQSPLRCQFASFALDATSRAERKWLEQMVKETLKVVHDDDLEGLLKGLGIYGDLVNDRMGCSFCGDTVTWDNLHSLFPDSGAVKASCSKPECVKQLLAWIDTRKHS